MNIFLIISSTFSLSALQVNTQFRRIDILQTSTLTKEEMLKQTYIAQSNVVTTLCDAKSGFEYDQSVLYFFTIVTCNVPATISYVSNLERSELVSGGNFATLRKIDFFTKLCSGKTVCSERKKIRDKRSAKYRVNTRYTLFGGTNPTTENAVSDNLYVNKKGVPYPFVKTTRTFAWGEVYLADNIPVSEKNRYIPFPSGKILLKQPITRKGNPLYACLQFMWKDRLKKLYEKNKWVIPNDNEAHHIYPVEYGGLNAYGSSFHHLHCPRFQVINVLRKLK